MSFIVQKFYQIGMLPDSFPVFNIDLDCDFESSDNVYPAFKPKQASKPAPTPTHNYLLREQNVTRFSHIGRRKDNLDRCQMLRVQQGLLLSVLDGHCDPQPVDYIETHLLDRIGKHPLLATQPQKALLEVFEELEREVIEKFDKGTTALVIYINGDQLIAANLGDGMLWGVDCEGTATPLTAPHNLDNQEELKAVIERGGIVLKKGKEYRINAELNLSRSFGDRKLKYCMSSRPDLYRFDRRQFPRWVLATDGFYLAAGAQERMSLCDLSGLEGCDYSDNASAVYIDL